METLDKILGKIGLANANKETLIALAVIIVLTVVIGNLWLILAGIAGAGATLFWLHRQGKLTETPGEILEDLIDDIVSDDEESETDAVPADNRED